MKMIVRAQITELFLQEYEFTALARERAFLTWRPCARRCLAPIKARKLSTLPSVDYDPEPASQGAWAMVSMMFIALLVAGSVVLARK
jgi:hypothetical protein